MLIPATQTMLWEWSHHSSSNCIVDPFKWWFSLWVREGKKVSLLPISIWLLPWDKVPSALWWDLGPLSSQSLGHSSLSSLQQADPTTQAIRWQTVESIWPPAMGAKQLAWTATQSCRIGRFSGSDKLSISACDHKSRVIFVIGLGLSLWLSLSTSMAPTDAPRYMTISYTKINYNYTKRWPQGLVGHNRPAKAMPFYVMVWRYFDNL